MRGAVGVIVFVWLLIGVFATWQRGYHGSPAATQAARRPGRSR